MLATRALAVGVVYNETDTCIPAILDRAWVHSTGEWLFGQKPGSVLPDPWISLAGTVALFDHSLQATLLEGLTIHGTHVKDAKRILRLGWIKSIHLFDFGRGAKRRVEI